jgi:hypothetical protein
MNQIRNLQCSRCKRQTTQLKYFYAQKNLCKYCYDLLYELCPCLDCFQQIERKLEEVSPIASNPIASNPKLFLCDVCKAQRNIQSASHQSNQTLQTSCSRTWFQCSKCANVHATRCTFVHTTDFNTSGRALEQKRQYRTLFRASNAVALQPVSYLQPVSNSQSNSQSELQTSDSGMYQWHKFLFCSYKCVQKTFEHVTWCAVCGQKPNIPLQKPNIPLQKPNIPLQKPTENPVKKCHRCRIPLCHECSKQWFTQERNHGSGGLQWWCQQCFVDTHPTWTRDELRDTFAIDDFTFQILQHRLPASIRTGVLERMKS